MERIEGGVVTPTTDLIAQIKALLEKATPGPWAADVGVYQDPDGEDDVAFARGPMVPRKGGESYNNHVGRVRKTDAALIAAAPTLLAACVEALEGMERSLRMEHVRDLERGIREEATRADADEAEVARLKDHIARMRPGTSGLLDELEAENARLKERVRELEGREYSTLAVAASRFDRSGKDAEVMSERKRDLAEKRIADLEEHVAELEVSLCDGNKELVAYEKRIATLTAALEEARVGGGEEP